MAEPDAVSLRKFAALQGWNPGQAHRLKVAGRLVMVKDAGGRELVHVTQSLARIAESSDPQKGYMAQVSARCTVALQQLQRRRLQALQRLLMRAHPHRSFSLHLKTAAMPHTTKRALRARSSRPSSPS